MATNTPNSTKTSPGPERNAALHGHIVLRHQDGDEQAKALDHEAESHQGEAGAVPGEQRALGGEEDSGIVQVGHCSSSIYVAYSPAFFSDCRNCGASW